MRCMLVHYIVCLKPNNFFNLNVPVQFRFSSTAILLDNLHDNTLFGKKQHEVLPTKTMTESNNNNNKIENE